MTFDEQDQLDPYQIVGMISDLLNLEPAAIKLTDRLEEDLKMDEPQLRELLLDIEDEYGVRVLSTKRGEAAKTVKGLIGFVRGRQTQRIKAKADRAPAGHCVRQESNYGNPFMDDNVRMPG